MYKDKDLISSTKGEIQGRAKDFGCRNDAIRLAKMLVGDSANSVQEQIEEWRNESQNYRDYITVRIPRKLLFTDEHLKRGEVEGE